ncbi:MAG: hypothetical protein IPK02_18210 [Candidatus Accumulibacter sp.]|uniref:Uncharacterized protein n=1 Tax=Candidatus Accumulibacter affinis TaxID=2954384 RepID=A0A935TBU7_9PROT|nr:hypothetical protein [Candidatus Accumulibacter affinis]
MAICATVDVAGFVKMLPGVALNDCTGYVLLDKADWINNGLVQGLLTIPAGEDFAALWGAGFVLPVTLSMIAWAVSKIVGVIR